MVIAQTVDLTDAIEGREASHASRKLTALIESDPQRSRAIGRITLHPTEHGVRVQRAGLHSYLYPVFDAEAPQHIELDINASCAEPAVFGVLLQILDLFDEGVEIRRQILRVDDGPAHALVFVPREERLREAVAATPAVSGPEEEFVHE